MLKALAYALVCFPILSFHIQAANSPVIISEFMADNTRTLVDEDNQYSDWIELHNISTNTVNLQNWSLTDEMQDLMRWRFPATNIEPGGYLVVFASGNDRRTPGAPLHTNFKLSRTGEFLALLEPGATNFASVFAPRFPGQVPDVSFGLGHDVQGLPLVATNSPAAISVPLDGAAGVLWTAPDYNDSGWIQGTNGVGYEVVPGEPGETPYGAMIATDIRAVMQNQNASAYIRLPFVVADPTLIEGLKLRMRYDDGFVAYLNGVEMLRVNAPGSQTIADAASEFSSTQGQDSWYYGYYNRSADSDGLYQLADFRPFPASSNVYGADNYWTGSSWDWYAGNPPWTALELQGGHPNGTNSGQPQHWAIRRWQSEMSGNLRVNVRYAKMNLTCGNGTTGRLFHNGNQKWFYTVPFSDSTGVSTSILLTNVALGDFIDFAIDPTGTDGLPTDNCDSTTFTIQIEPETPGELAWNSKALAPRSNVQGRQFQEYDLFAGIRHLTLGTNVLAIHGLNCEATNADFLIQAELQASVAVAPEQSVMRYFTRPTPGAPNSSGTVDLGPVITDVQFTPGLPGDNDDIVITARIAPAFALVATNKLIYRINYNSEVTIPMLDDGAHGDGLRYDGIYGAIIPAAAAGPNQMVRWYVTSLDMSNRVSRWPLYLDANQSPQYLGTMISDPLLTNPLPVLHWFIQTPNNANNDTGTRCSLFFRGEFYDNVYVNIHGQSSRNFPKKSYDLEFNPGCQFRYDPDQEPVGDINMLTTYPDKAHMRNVLAYETYRNAGSPYHFVVPVRVQQNGVFWGTAHLVENGDAEYLSRNGLDPNGSLYKMYNNFTISPDHATIGTSLAEKKTRKQEGNADLLALLNGSLLVGETRRVFLYDNVNIPEMVNFMAARVITSDQDCCHKNYYLYRDTEGDRLWQALPWDVDLSFGRRWISALTYWDDAMVVDTAIPFAAYNGLFAALTNTPEVRQMFWRRLRTLMDDLLQPPGTPANQLKFEQRMYQLAAEIGPDAALDLAKWGTWCNGSPGPFTQATIPIATNYQTLLQAVELCVNNFMNQKRLLLFTNRSVSMGGEIPAMQPANTLVRVGSIEFNPASGNQGQEYIQLTNVNPYAVDISGWQLAGAVNFTFKGGTVIPSNGVLYVSPDLVSFRARTNGPRAGLGLLGVGPYQGQLSARGETIELLGRNGVVVHQLVYQGNPSLAQRYLRITEIMYHPTVLEGDTNGVEEFEYIEFKNIGPVALNLNGVHFTNGLDFAFSGSAVTNLQPGARVVVVKNEAAFVARYGSGLPVAGTYLGNLDNDGERLRLLDASGEEILDFRYQDNWYPITDGLGFSLVVVDEQAEPDAWDRKEHWRPSGVVQGSPGADEGSAPVFQAILINEALTRTDFPPPTDTIELYNPGTNEVDISGWYLTDDFETPAKFAIPAGTRLAPQGFITFNESHFNPNAGEPPSFGLSSGGEEVYLFGVDTNTGKINGYYHGFDFGPAEEMVSFGRYVTSEGEEHFVSQIERSFLNTNAGPKVGPLVISEIMYRPPDLGTNDNTQDEFIEVLNISSNTVSLYCAEFPTNTWKISGGIDYVFPTNVTLAAGETLLLVNFAPTNTIQLAAFRALYGLGTNLQIFGPYGGKLNNDSDRVELTKPTAQQAFPVAVFYVLVDKVSYRDDGAWPRAADGLGYSMQRWDNAAYGNDPINWYAARASAGQAPNQRDFPRLTAPLGDRVVLVGESPLLQVSASGSEPFVYQWRFNGTNILDATNSFLQLLDVTMAFSGYYDVLVENESGATLSRRAKLTVRSPVAILQQPQDISVRAAPDPGWRLTNVTFTVDAFSVAALRYQWLSNGIDILNATNSSLTITNVQTNHWAQYSVRVSDDASSVLSESAWLLPLVRLQFMQPPVSQRVAVNSPVTLSGRITGWPPPFTFEWRCHTNLLATHVEDNGLTFFSFIAPSIPTNQNYRITARSPGFPSGVLSPIMYLTVVADTDADGMPDEWETRYGFNPTNALDMVIDVDGDGMSNAQEYQAGTDPTNNLSYLKIDSLLSVNGVYRMEFWSSSNKTYTLQGADNPYFTNWWPVGHVAATTNARRNTIVDGSWGTNRFYRVVTPRLLP